MISARDPIEPTKPSLNLTLSNQKQERVDEQTRLHLAHKKEMQLGMDISGKINGTMGDSTTVAISIATMFHSLKIICDCVPYLRDN